MTHPPKQFECHSLQNTTINQLFFAKPSYMVAFYLRKKKTQLFLTQLLNIFHPLNDLKSLLLTKFLTESIRLFRNTLNILFIIIPCLFLFLLLLFCSFYSFFMLPSILFFHLFPGTLRILVPAAGDICLVCLLCLF